MTGYTNHMDNITLKLAKIRSKQIDEFAAAFTKKVDLNPEEIVMFQTNVQWVNGKLVQKTFFTKKDNEEVKIIENLKEQIKSLHKRLKLEIEDEDE